MKPTFQIKRPARRIESERSCDYSVHKSPATDWSFQAGSDLRAGAANFTSQTPSVRGGLYAVTQGLYETQTKWEDRIEAVGLCVVVALASWPIMQAVHIALRTV